MPSFEDQAEYSLPIAGSGGGGGGAVDSVFGRTGVVVAASGDYAVADITGLQTALDAKVAGPASAVDNRVARFDLTTGKIIQSSAVTIDDSGNCSGIGTVACGTITVTGNIVVSGTVDGRDVSVDGATLDALATTVGTNTSNISSNTSAIALKADKSWTVRTVIGTTDTTLSADQNNPVLCTNAGAVAVTVPSGLPLGVYPYYVNGGASTQLTFAGSGGLTVLPPPGLTLKTRTGAVGAAVAINVLSSTLAILSGDVASV